MTREHPTEQSIPHAWEPLLTRRDLLRIGAVGVASQALPGLSGAASAAKARSVIVLWMAGGVTHHESFDPKPSAPAEIRGNLGAIATTLPGVRFGEVMPRLAELAHQLTVIRSFVPATNDHFLAQAFALSGRRVTADRIRTEPNVGSVVSHLLGPRAGLPAYITVPGTTRPGPPPTNLFVSGWLAREHEPFASGGRPRNDDFTAAVPEASEDDFHLQALSSLPGMDSSRLRSRQSLHEQLDGALRALERKRSTSLDQQFASTVDRAFQMLLSPSVRRAFDLRQEPEGVRDNYGKTKIGQRCLLARRLVEAGARFVLVDYGYDPDFGNLWDNHNAPVQKHPPICEIVKLPWHLAGTDRACAALLRDLAVRGLLDQTLVVFLTEFGRTPKINREGGRDHWGTAGSVFLAGGGTRAGQVIGATDATGAEPRGLTVSPADLVATIYQGLGIDRQTMLTDRFARPLPLLEEGKSIPGVF